MKKIEEKVDAKKVIKDLAKSYGDSNEDQGKMVALMKGLAFSDDPAANKFMKALDKWTTSYAEKVKESTQEENILKIKEEVVINETVILEAGDKIKVLEKE